MNEGRSRMEWQHTSAILCVLVNAHRDTKKHKQPFAPSDFNPHEKGGGRRGLPIKKKNIGILRRLFCSAFGREAKSS